MNIREKIPAQDDVYVMNVLKNFQLTDEERNFFLASPKRRDKIRGIEKYKNARIVAEIVQSDACIAGHKKGTRIYFDSAGRLLPAETGIPVCVRLLNKLWYRVIMIMDRMADSSLNSIGDGKFEGELVDVRMACYSAQYPYGDCGQVIMKISVENI